jgi:DNA polymerase-1
MILTVHDELVFEVAPGDVEALRDLVLGRMQGVAQLAVALDARVGWGRNWREAH